MGYTCENCQNTLEVNNMTCPECCEHDYDIDEGYTCINCGTQGDFGELIDSAEYHFNPER